jgi:hypothetical protein
MNKQDIEALFCQLMTLEERQRTCIHKYTSMQLPSDPSDYLDEAKQQLDRAMRFIARDGFGWRIRTKLRQTKARRGVEEAERLVAADTPEDKKHRREAWQRNIEMMNELTKITSDIRDLKIQISTTERALAEVDAGAEEAEEGNQDWRVE